MTEVKAYAAASSSADLAPLDIKRRDTTAQDVEIDILF